MDRNTQRKYDLALKRGEILRIEGDRIVSEGFLPRLTDARGQYLSGKYEDNP